MDHLPATHSPPAWISRSLLGPIHLSILTHFHHTHRRPNPQHSVSVPGHQMNIWCLLDWTVSVSLWLGLGPLDPDQQCLSLQLEALLSHREKEALHFPHTPRPRMEPSLPPGTGVLLGRERHCLPTLRAGIPSSKAERTQDPEVTCPPSSEPGQGKQRPG